MDEVLHRKEICRSISSNTLKSLPLNVTSVENRMKINHFCNNTWHFIIMGIKLCELCLRKGYQNLNRNSVQQLQIGALQIKRYPCPRCSYVAISCSSLKIHLRTHTGERPHKCPFCGKGFRQSGTMYRHRQTYCRQRPF